MGVYNTDHCGCGVGMYNTDQVGVVWACTTWIRWVWCGRVHTDQVGMVWVCTTLMKWVWYHPNRVNTPTHSGVTLQTEVKWYNS